MRSDYRNLLVWQRSMDLTERVYTLTRRFPPDERFGLTSQMRRAAVSVPSNIAEGQGRLSAGEFRQFLSNAIGSLQELETQVLLSRRLGYLAQPEADEVLQSAAETAKLLNRLAMSNLSKHGAFSRNRSPTTAP